MINKAKKFIRDYFSIGSQRSILAKKNIIASFFIKGVSMVISLILVPLTIHYINPTQYGIWLTLSSIVAWISFFDIGFGNGLRNKFAEAKAKGEIIIARKYVSTTYAMLAIIFTSVWILFILVNIFIDWSTLLNAPNEMADELSRLAIIVVSFFCLQFVLKIVNIVLIADQRPAIAAFFDMIGQLLALIIIFILTKTTNGSLIYLGIALGFSPVFILIISTLLMYIKKYRSFKPSFAFVDFSYARDIMGLGYKFFIIQIAGIVQFQTTVFIIAHFFGSLEVTNYNIAFRLFGIMSMVYTIFLTPFWSAVTEAYFKKDYNWIIKSVKKYLNLWLFIAIAGLVVLVFSNRVYDLWIGKGIVNIDFRISLWIYIYFLVMTFGSVFVNVLNGMGAIRIQYIASIISPLIFIIATVVLVKYMHIGVYAVIIASICANFNGLILAPLQYYKVYLKKRDGIWIQ